MRPMMRTNLIALGIGIAALIALAVCLILGLGNHDFLAALVAGGLFLLAALCMSPSHIRPLTPVVLLIPLLGFSLVYMASADWDVQVLGFFGTIDLCAAVAVVSGLGLRRGVHAQRMAKPAVGSVAAAAIILSSAWFLPTYAHRYQERTQMTDSDYPAPELRLTDLAGNTVDLQQLRGKVVVLDFWATWCGPCLHEMPALDAMAKDYAGKPDVAIYAIAANQDETAEVVSGFLKDNHYSLDAAYDTDGAAARAFHAATFPTLVIIDAKGAVRYKHNGFNTDASPFQTIVAKIESLRQNHT